MKRNKDFKEYSNKRIWKEPRSLIINTFMKSIDDLMEMHQENNSDVIICEFGFNHANDSRYMCELLYERYGTSGWKYYGYDHKDYFMPENFGLSIGEKYYENLNLVPCTFEEIARGEVSLPPYISFLYSSKSLSLCDDEYFVQLISRIINSYALKCYDKFGEYGIVGYVSYEKINYVIEIREFVLSCRVACKQIESALFSGLLQKEKIPKGILKLNKTQKNVVLRNTLKDAGFINLFESDGEITYEFTSELNNSKIVRIDFEQEIFRDGKKT